MDYESEIIVAAVSTMNMCLLAHSELEKEKSRRNVRRSCWVKKWRETRNVYGNIQYLLREYKLAGDDKTFKSYLLMDEYVFEELFAYVKDDITKMDTHLRKCIPAKETLAVTLRYLSTGENFKELAENTKLSKSFIQENVLIVCNAIYNRLKSDFLKFPDTKEKWMQISTDFEKLWQFPNCLGALDGKHFAFTPKGDEANKFYNYKGFRSIVLLALADAHAKFIFIDVGYNGRISDGGIFSRSALYEIVRNPSKYLPEPRIIGDNRKLPYVILADNAFPLQINLMTPFSNKCIDQRSRSFNTRLSRARQNIERAFGILSNRFKIFQTTIKLNETKAAEIIACCCVLHNFLIERSPWYMNNVDQSLFLDETHNDVPTVLPANNTPPKIKTTRKDAEEVRKQFVEYFMNEGAI